VFLFVIYVTSIYVGVGTEVEGNIEILKDNPPGDNWDGSFTFTKK